MSDLPSREQYEQNVKVAESCGADKSGARTLAMGGEHAGLLVSDAVKACYDSGGPGDQRSMLERFTAQFKGLLSSVFQGAAAVLDATGIPDVKDALDRANTSESEQNRRWEREINKATGPSPSPSPGPGPG